MNLSLAFEQAGPGVVGPLDMIEVFAGSHLALLLVSASAQQLASR